MFLACIYIGQHESCLTFISFHQFKCKLFTYHLHSFMTSFTENSLQNSVSESNVGLTKVDEVSFGEEKLPEAAAGVQKSSLPEISYKNPTMLLNEKRKGIKVLLTS